MDEINGLEIPRCLSCGAMNQQECECEFYGWLDSISSLGVIEPSQWVKSIQDEFGVTEKRAFPIVRRWNERRIAGSQ